jgi:hypothetical protein
VSARQGKSSSGISGDLRAIEEIHDRVDEPDLQDEVQTEDEPVNWTFEWKNAES